MKTLITSALFLGAFLFLFTACTAEPDYAAMYDSKIATITDAWNTGNVATLDEIYTDDAVRTSGIAAAEGREAIKEMITQTRQAFPDLKIDREDIIYTDGKVIARWTAHATPAGTAKTLHVPVISIAEFNDQGQVVREWATVDNLESYLAAGFTLLPPASDTTAISE